MYQFFTSDLFGIPVDTVNMIANGAVALAVLLVLYMLYRLFTRPRMASGRRSKNARLAITDAASIDDRRRIVLVRRDDVEHLIMIGGTNDLVIESEINKRGAGRPAAPSQQPPRAAPGERRQQPAPPNPSAPNRPPAPSGDPRRPAAANSPAPNPQSSKSPPSAAISSPGSPPKPSPGKVDPSPVIGNVGNRPADASSKPKGTVGDNMDSLLTEITSKK